MRIKVLAAVLVAASATAASAVSLVTPGHSWSSGAWTVEKKGPICEISARGAADGRLSIVIERGGAAGTATYYPAPQANAQPFGFTSFAIDGEKPEPVFAASEDAFERVLTKAALEKPAAFLKTLSLGDVVTIDMGDDGTATGMRDEFALGNFDAAADKAAAWCDVTLVSAVVN